MSPNAGETVRLEDAVLTRAAQAGDVAALGLLLERHRAGMRAVALSILGPGPDVDDVVLVHGGFVDGSGWQGVHERLVEAGYKVSIVQNPTQSLPGDVAATLQVVAEQDGPTVLVGHSYGGVVITEAGRDPKVSALVYVAAFAPDEGESVNTLIADPPPGAPVPPILPPKDGQLLLDRERFHASFAGDLPQAQARFMADSQVPWGVEALNGAVGVPAWRTKSSWYLVAADDRMIPPPAQRAMAERAGATVAEAPGSHSIYVSQPAVVVDMISQATAAQVASGK